MNEKSAIALEVARRRKWIEGQEILLDVLERDGADVSKELAAIEEERQLLKSQLIRLQLLEQPS